MSACDCGQPTIITSQGCFTANGATVSTTIDIIRTFMPDPNNVGKTVLTETRYVKPTASGPMPFVPDFVGGDSITAGACPLPQVVMNAPGDLESACYEMPDGSIVPIKVTTEVDSAGNIISVHGYTLPTLQPIPAFDQTKLTTCVCPAPTNTGVNPSW